MLTQEIKQKIDSARDILVGKIPTPTGQVEQITLALVYKFMNDIDEQNVELGGSHKFFTGEYTKYAWKHLLDKSLSAYERVTLYGEGLDKMHLNPNLPQFFRNVFKRAFLPFRDPDVLTLFLKEIDGFTYGHNGDLGDAFEYLLQVMGTQGDAGQFLTPRHIINFIVSIVDPQKTEKILDPAVGTSGFLISAYQHILRMNTKKGSSLPGSALTPDERKRFANNFVGYDVSHDMVRLSLVNMYLHDFPDPKINEYDTLTSMDKWDDDFDCILTNPPFMTPKGGIRPHKRFSIQAKRSEVLFVDYIMEHLNPNGKAGIIVPEGIIFQSAAAYKALRKMMIDQNYLYAVISLPSGIFQPYSGVKTSILLMDKVLAKKTDSILFVKVENDGFDLGAQRRPIDKNDLPRAAEILQRYKRYIQTGVSFELSEEEKQVANLIPIEKISKSGDYNLSGDRYKETIIIGKQKWPLVELGEVCTFEYGKPLKEENRRGGVYPVFGSNGIVGYHNEYLVEAPFIIVGRKGTAGAVVYSERNGYPIDTTFFVKLQSANNIDIKFLYYILGTLGLDQLNTQSGVPGLNRNDAYKIQIPLPPLEVQQDIVSQLDRYQKIIDGAKQVIDNYKPEIKIDPDWEVIELGQYCDVKGGKRIPKDMNFSNIVTDHPYIRVIDFKNYSIDLNNLKYIDDIVFHEIKNYTISSEDVYISIAGTIGLVGMIPKELDGANLTENAAKLIINDNGIDLRYLVYILSDKTSQNQIKKLTHAVGVPKLALERIRTIKFPLPPLDIQKQIVSRIEEEQQLVDANKKLIEIYERKIKEKINEVWGITE